MNNRKAFTLIELLAVIIILGLLMAIAVGGVGKYIEDSRKKMYIATAESFISEIVKKTTSLEYSFFDEDTSYYVHIDNIDLEKGGLSPYGDGQWLDAWIALTYNGNEYTYYWVSVDSSSQRVDLTPASELDKNLVHASKQTTINNREPIGMRSKIYIIDKDGKVIEDSSRLELAADVAKECYSYTDNTDGTITINYYQPTCPKDVVVPASIDGKEVIGIHSSTFSTMNIRSVILPNTIKTIGNQAFYNNKIKHLELPSSITKIENNAFSTNEIETLVFNEGISSIGTNSFKKNNISVLNLPDSLTNIGACAFCLNPIPNPSFMYAKSGDVTDYSTLTGYIGDLSEFENQTLVIPPVAGGVALKTIGENAFYHMGLNNWTIQIPDSVTTIMPYAFGINQIKATNLPSSLKTIGSGAFYSNRLTELNIPSTVTSIGNNAFNINLVTNPEELWIYKRTASGIDYSTVVSYAGANRDNLVVPASKNGVALTTISNNTLYALALTGTLKLPNTISTISGNTFTHNNLTAVDNGDGDTSRGPYIFKKTNGVIDYSTVVAYVGRGGKAVVPKDVKEISTGAFVYTIITSVELPEGLETIGPSAFDYCYLSGTIEIPSTVKSIGNRAFAKSISDGTKMNFNINKIINKTGRAFNWSSVAGNHGPASGNIVTGTVENWYGDIEITDK